MKYVASIDDQDIAIDVDAEGQVCSMTVEGSSDDVDCVRISAASYSVIIAGKSYHLQVHQNQRGVEVLHRNRPVKVLLKDETDLLREKYGMGTIAAEMHGVIQAPIPGRVVRISVNEGDPVERGASLMVLEAMKMENEIKADIAGRIDKIHVDEGQNIEKDTILIEIEPE